MATETQKSSPPDDRSSQKGDKPRSAAAPQPRAKDAQLNVLDELREKRKSEQRDIIPIPALAAIFLFVEITIVALMMSGKWWGDFDLFMAHVYTRNGNYLASSKIMEKLVQKDPKNATFQNDLAYLDLHLGKYDDAIRHFQDAQSNVGAAPASDDGPRETPVFYTPMGRAAFLKGDNAAAEAYLKKALAANRIDLDANFTMGELQFKLGNYRKASEYFKVVADIPAYKEKVREYYAKTEQTLFAGIK